MTEITAGSVVSIHYIGTLDNGRIFDSTQDRSPLTFTIGGCEVFPALENAVKRMRVGEVRNVVVAAADAFGPRLEENVITVARSVFPEGREIKAGQKLNVEFGQNASKKMVVSAVTDGSVTLDGNHPLAGLDLTFALRLETVIEKHR